MVDYVDIPGDFVTQRLGGDDGHLLADTLVGVEVQTQSSVVLLDDDLGGLLDGLCPNTTLQETRTMSKRVKGAEIVQHLPL